LKELAEAPTLTKLEKEHELLAVMPVFTVNSGVWIGISRRVNEDADFSEEGDFYRGVDGYGQRLSVMIGLDDGYSDKRIIEDDIRKIIPAVLRWKQAVDRQQGPEVVMHGPPMTRDGVMRVFGTSGEVFVMIPKVEWLNILCRAQASRSASYQDISNAVNEAVASDMARFNTAAREAMMTFGGQHYGSMEGLIHAIATCDLDAMSDTAPRGAGGKKATSKERERWYEEQGLKLWDLWNHAAARLRVFNLKTKEIEQVTSFAAINITEGRNAFLPGEPVSRDKVIASLKRWRANSLGQAHETLRTEREQSARKQGWGKPG
jgi:hypothetical protein